MLAKLTEEQTLQFVSLYREHAVLWDITSDCYKNKAVRHSALQKICEDMKIEGMTIEDVKNKIKSIRSTYYLELDKIKKSTTSGASGTVYQPKVKWFAKFHSFIKNAMVKRKTQDNTESIDCGYGESDVPPTPEPRRKKSRTSHSPTIVKEIQADLPKSEMEEDEFDVFGKHVAKQLRKLSAEQAILGQGEIQSVITKCRLNDLRCRNRSRNADPEASVALCSPASTTDTSDHSLPCDEPECVISEYHPHFHNA